MYFNIFVAIDATTNAMDVAVAGTRICTASTTNAMDATSIISRIYTRRVYSTTTVPNCAYWDECDHK